MRMLPITEATESTALPSVASVPVGKFPKRIDTVTAEGLAKFLRHEHLDGMDGMKMGTSRFSSQIMTLRKSYGWPVETKDKDVHTSDGRISTVAVYSLPPEVVEAARAEGAEEWCERVFDARRQRRQAARSM